MIELDVEVAEMKRRAAWVELRRAGVQHPMRPGFGQHLRDPVEDVRLPGHERVAQRLAGLRIDPDLADVELLEERDERREAGGREEGARALERFGAVAV